MKSKLIFPVALACIGLVTLSCNPADKTENVETTEKVADEVVEEDFVVVVGEHHINQTPITSHPTAKPAAKVVDDEPYQTIPAVEFQDAIIVEYEIEPVAAPESILIAIPLDETQTVMSYNRKGKDTGAIQIVSDSNGEIDHILFQDKNHKDVYDVKAGMTAKEVKKLRKEMKHMVKKGQVFYYADDSNIMYILDTIVPGEGEIVEAEIEESVVTTVVWKDKKHKDHPKNSK